MRMNERTGNGIIESLLGEVAGLIWGIENFIIENREVESEAKTDWVSGCKISSRDLGCCLVSLQ